MYEKQVLTEAFLEMIKNSEYSLSLLRIGSSSFLLNIFQVVGMAGDY